jgi:predicted PurR-regulated permease PerM
MLKDLGKEIDKPKDAASARGPNPIVNSNASGPQAPVPVEVRQPDPGALENLRTLISPLVHPLATTGIIIIFVIFILLQREDLRNRLIRLAGSYDLQRTTAALDDAAGRLSRLFLTQLILNSAFGVVIGIGLWLIGTPSAILWGILATVLRFVTYIGAVTNLTRSPSRKSLQPPLREILMREQQYNFASYRPSQSLVTTQFASRQA